MRHSFGGSPSDYAMEKVGTGLVLRPAAVGTVWDALSGGTQYTDLTDSAGNPITSVTADGDGAVFFNGPDGVTNCYTDFGYGRRYALTAINALMALTSTKSLVIPAPTVAVTYVIWRAPRACTVTAVRGYRQGGTGATINATANGADLAATDLSLSTDTTWLSAPALQNTSIAAGDSIAVAVRTVAGTPAAVTIQLDVQGL